MCCVGVVMEIKTLSILQHIQESQEELHSTEKAKGSGGTVNATTVPPNI